MGERLGLSGRLVDDASDVDIMQAWWERHLQPAFDRARMNAEERLQAAFGAELERTGVTDPYELPDEWIATTQGRLLKEEYEQATQATYRDWFDAEIEFRPRRAAEDVEGVGEPAATGREPSVRDAAPDVEGRGHRGVEEAPRRDFAGRVTEPLSLSFPKGSGENGGWNVVSHGGNNTVNETLAAGKPLLVMPVGGEQADNATRVEWLGAGLRAEHGRHGPDEIGELVARLVEEPGFRQRAEELAEELSRTRGVETCARLLERLAETRAPLRRAGPLTVYAGSVPWRLDQASP